MTEREPFPHYDVVVVGGGPAGYTAMIYLANDHINALCVEGFESGGQLTRAERINNFPGFPGGLGGAELPERMRDQGEQLGGHYAFDEVTAIDSSSGRFVVNGTMESWTSDAVILATGAKARELGLESEAALRNRGVGYCALCDGSLFAGKRVAVVGGGDAAVEQAQTLTHLDCDVTIVHRRRTFKAARSGVAFLEDHPKVEILVPYVVDEMLGVEDQRLRGLRLLDTETGDVRDLDVDAVFVAIGHDPASDLLADRVETDHHGFVVTRGKTSRTSLEGVFAAGDVIDPLYRQAITAAATGCIAAIDASRWLAERKSHRTPSGRAASESTSG